MKRLFELLTLCAIALLFVATSWGLPVRHPRPDPVDACHVKCDNQYRCNQRCRGKANHEHCMEMCNHYKANCKARCDKKVKE